MDTQTGKNLTVLFDISNSLHKMVEENPMLQTSTTLELMATMDAALDMAKKRMAEETPTVVSDNISPDGIITDTIILDGDTLSMETPFCYHEPECENCELYDECEEGVEGAYKLIIEDYVSGDILATYTMDKFSLTDTLSNNKGESGVTIFIPEEFLVSVE